jgi:hypothetical protein
MSACMAISGRFSKRIGRVRGGIGNAVEAGGSSSLARDLARPSLGGLQELHFSPRVPVCGHTSGSGHVSGSGHASGAG